MSTEAGRPHGARGAHRSHADAVRAAVMSEAGGTEVSVRAAVLARAAGGGAAAEPYDALARQIGAAAYRVTDAQVEAVRAAEGSDRRAFEIIMSACVGPGLARWDTALRVIDEATDASA